MFFTVLITFVAGGLVGWWLGSSRTKDQVNRTWMAALESAVTDDIIDDEQQSQVIRIQGSHTQSR